MLHDGGALVTAGEFGGFAPIAAEATASGYEIAWKMAGQDTYTAWSVDSSGHYIANVIGTVAGSDTGLESLETSFHQDLNGDGTIGVPTTVIESFGSTSLAAVSTSLTNMSPPIWLRIDVKESIRPWILGAIWLT